MEAFRYRQIDICEEYDPYISYGVAFYALLSEAGPIPPHETAHVHSDSVDNGDSYFLCAHSTFLGSRGRKFPICAHLPDAFSGAGRGPLLKTRKPDAEP